MRPVLRYLRTRALPLALLPALLFAGCTDGALPTAAPSGGAGLNTGATATGSPTLVISQVYGGGGNSGAPFTHDFVEIFNRGSTEVSLNDLSIQYTSATGGGNFGANAGQLVAMSGSLKSGQYYLVQLGGGSNGEALPAPDATGTINMAAGAGKVALVTGTAGLGCNGGSTPCSAEQLARMMDLVGYGGANFFEGSGAAPTLNNTTAALRNEGGCTDTDNNAADFTAAGPVPRNSTSPTKSCPAVEPPPADEDPPIDTCESLFTAIYTIQGSGASTPLAGQTVTTQGVVIGDFQGLAPALGGFYMQDPEGDNDPATSDGIFVFNRGQEPVAIGELVRVTGTATEFQGQTQISNVSSTLTCGSDFTIRPTDVTLPFASADYLERYEGMLVRLPQTLTVTEHFHLGRFGAVVMSSGGRLFQPTQVAAPGAAAAAVQAGNDLNRIIVDDELNSQNPDPILFGRGGNPLSAANTLRGGDQATGIVGVMTYTWAGNAASGNAYRVRPVGAMGGEVPDFKPANPRPATPASVGGSLKVAAFNVYNYFNTFNPADRVFGCTGGVGGAAVDCRGARSAAEFERQWRKTVAAIVTMNVDVLGVMEIENDGYDSESAIADLVNKLNAATAPGTYAFINADSATGEVNALGTDAIKNGIIYKPAKVKPIGATAALNTVDFVNGGDNRPRSRPSLAQAFVKPGNGSRFVVSVNHLKSKGSACNVPDARDGQGNCNAVRTRAANELLAWLASDPTETSEPNVLIIGDLNSYAGEDPIRALVDGGFTDLAQSRVGSSAYSYAFNGQWGTLDYALASQSLASQVTGVTEWHINADEPIVLDYSAAFKSADQLVSLYSPDPFRASDHDPMIVGLELRPGRSRNP